MGTLDYLALQKTRQNTTSNSPPNIRQKMDDYDRQQEELSLAASSNKRASVTDPATAPRRHKHPRVSLLPSSSPGDADVHTSSSPVSAAASLSPEESNVLSTAVAPRMTPSWSNKDIESSSVHTFVTQLSCAGQELGNTSFFLDSNFVGTPNAPPSKPRCRFRNVIRRLKECVLSPKFSGLQGDDKAKERAQLLAFWNQSLCPKNGIPCGKYRLRENQITKSDIGKGSEACAEALYNELKEWVQSFEDRREPFQEKWKNNEHARKAVERVRKCSTKFLSITNYKAMQVSHVYGALEKVGPALRDMNQVENWKKKPPVDDADSNEE
jgi:hypothetical protein